MKPAYFIRICLISFCLVFSYNNTCAQNTDSLIGLLRTAKNDTNKVRLYQQIALNYFYSDAVKAEGYIDQSLKLAEQLGHNKSLANAYGLKGTVYSLEGRSDEAELYLQKALALFKKMKNQEGQANIMNNLGELYLKQERYGKSLAYRLKALELSEESKDKKRIARILTGLAGVYTKTGQYAEAEKYHRRNLKIKQELGDRRGESVVYANMGAMFYEQSKDSAAMDCVRRSLELQKEFNDNYIIVSCNETMAGILVHKDDFPQALIAYNRCYEIYADSKDSIGMMRTLMGRASAKHAMGDCQGAEQDYKEGLQMQTDTSFTELTRSAYYGLCLVYACLGEQKKAHDYLDKLLNLTQKVFNNQLSANMSELKVKYEAEKKEKDNRLLREQNKTSTALVQKNRLWIMVISVLALLLLLVIFLILALNRNKKKQKQIEFIKIKAELEQTALRAQMNPHFIFNALNSIQHYVLNGDTEYAYDYLAKFSRLIRQILVNSEHSTISLSKEIDMLKLYIELEQRRFKNRFDFEIVYANDFPADDVRIPTMLIQPFVENAIWHGIMNLDKNIKGELQLEFDLMEKDLHIAVRDNGVGRKEAALRRINNEYQSVGMAFTKKRLELIGAVSKQKAQINIVDRMDPEGKAAGTMVEIVIALEVEA